MGVYNASWKRPYGFDRLIPNSKSFQSITVLQIFSDIVTILDLPAIHISHRDAEEYCFWRGNEKEFVVDI